MDMTLDSREIRKNNIIARILGEDKFDGKLIKFITDPTNERIGNFNQLKDVADDIDENSIDYSVKWGDLHAGREFDNLYLDLSKSGESAGNLSLSSNGLTNMCSQLDIPTLYIKKCLGAEEIQHAADELNFWLGRHKAPEKEAFVRTTNDRIHGILSSKYSVFDDHEVLDIAEGILGPYDEYTVKNYHISPEYMKLRIVSRNKININGRDLSFGFDLKNSRVGKSSLETSILIFDWVCSNGMIFGGGQGTFFRKRHVGVDRELFVTEFTNMLDGAPDAIEFIKKSANAAHNERLDSDSIQRYIDRFKAQSFSKHVAGRVEQMLHEKYDTTLYGFLASVTEVAQEYDVDTRENGKVCRRYNLFNRKESCINKGEL